MQQTTGHILAQPKQAEDATPVFGANEAAWLISCLRGAAIEPPSNLDWRIVLRLARANGVLALIDDRLRASGVQTPEWFLEQAREVLEAGERLARELELLLNAFGARSIEIMPLKGPAMGQALYGDVGLRPSVDLDLLVRHRDLERSEALLRELGFTAKPTSDYDVRFRRDGLSVELHFELASPQYCKFDIDGVWARSRAGEFRGRPIRAMSDEDLVFYLCAHGLKHGFSRLIWIADIARALAQCAPGGCEQLMRDARRQGLAAWLLLGCEVVRAFFPEQLPAEMDTAIEPVKAAAMRARGVAERLFSEERALVLSDHRELYLEAEPSALRRWRYRCRYFAPTGSDFLWAKKHGIRPELMVALRPFRVLKKYGAGKVWLTLFPPRA